MDQNTEGPSPSCGARLIRAAYPTSTALLAAATNAEQIAADFRARRHLDDCDMSALIAQQRQSTPPHFPAQRRSAPAGAAA